MYLPSDPFVNNELWQSFKLYLNKTHVYQSIISGQKNFLEKKKIKMNSNQISELISRFKKSDYVRIGTNRTVPFPPHFALKFVTRSKAILTELINIDTSISSIADEIIFVSQLIFLELPQLHELIIPFIIKDISNKDVIIKIDEKMSHMIITKKNQ